MQLSPRVLQHMRTVRLSPTSARPQADCRVHVFHYNKLNEESLSAPDWHFPDQHLMNTDCILLQYYQKMVGRFKTFREGCRRTKLRMCEWNRHLIHQTTCGYTQFEWIYGLPVCVTGKNKTLSCVGHYNCHLRTLYFISVPLDVKDGINTPE